MESAIIAAVILLIIFLIICQLRETKRSNEMHRLNQQARHNASQSKDNAAQHLLSFDTPELLQSGVAFRDRPIPDAVVQLLLKPRFDMNDLPSLLRASIMCSNETDVQYAVVLILKELSKVSLNHPNPAQLLDSGVIGRCVQMVRLYPCCPKIAQCCGQVLRNLSAISDVFRDRVVAAGGVEAVVDLLCRHDHVIQITEDAVRTLRELATPAHSERLIQAKAVEALIAIAIAPGTRIRALLNICQVLQRLTYTQPDDRVSTTRAIKISACGAVECMATIVKGNRPESELQRTALMLLAALCKHRDNIRTLVRCAGITDVAFAMKWHIIDIILVKQGTLIIGNVSAMVMDESTERAVTEAECVPVIAHAMQQHPDNRPVQEDALLTLRNILNNRSGCLDDSQMTAKSVEPILNAMKHYEAMYDIQHRGCVCLARLCVDEDIAKLVGAAGGIDVILNC